MTWGFRNTPVTKIGYDVHQEWRPYFHSYRPPGQSGLVSAHLPACLGGFLILPRQKSSRWVWVLPRLPVLAEI